jgi:hypothetical protein
MIALALGWLYFTVPAMNAYTEGDSVYICTNGDSTRDVSMVYLHGYPITGGGYRIVDSLDVRGHEGEMDSIPYPWEGHYYLTTSDNTGEATCESNEVYVGPITGVSEGDGWPGAPRLLSMRYYDISGREIDWPPRTSCIYWQVSDWSDGTRKVRKLVHLK